MDSEKQYWAIIPAAGVGKRMGSKVPKQYLPLAGKTVLEQTISVFLQHPKISGIVVAITQGDTYWQELQSSLGNHKPILQALGGSERCHSVLNALTYLSNQKNFNISEQDWVLVHDAARPCLNSNDIDRLMIQLSDTTSGGLLGLPISDTVKRCNAEQQILETVDRNDLWRALTPQMFPFALLKNALEQAINNNALVTDEASAIEFQGLKPIMVEGSADNIKITHPGDLQLAEMFISAQNKVVSI